MANTWKEASEILNKGGVGVIPTDTLYGLVGSALSKNTVERIYKIKGRDDGKPFVVLISSFNDLKHFNIKPVAHDGRKWDKVLGKLWPGKVSILLPCPNKSFLYLHRGTNAIAFRMISPKHKNLFALINKVGPIVAPSANPQGLKPAKNITEAKDYFNINADFYVSNGTIKNTKPSTLLDYNQGEWVILRQGSVKINKNSDL